LLNAGVKPGRQTAEAARPQLMIRGTARRKHVVRDGDSVDARGEQAWMRITPRHIERAFRRIDDFYSVQGWPADHPTTEEDMEQSVEPIVALLTSVGLTLEAVVAFKRHREGGSDEEFIGLIVGVLARELAEEGAAG
jgi:hypothetical protein